MNVGSPNADEPVPSKFIDAPAVGRDKLPPSHTLFAIPSPPDITKAPLPVDVESTVDITANELHDIPPATDTADADVLAIVNVVPVVVDIVRVGVRTALITVSELHDIPPATDTAATFVLETVNVVPVVFETNSVGVFINPTAIVTVPLPPNDPTVN